MEYANIHYKNAKTLPEDPEGQRLQVEENDRGHAGENGDEFQHRQLFFEESAGDDGHQHTNTAVDHGVENGGGHLGVQRHQNTVADERTQRSAGQDYSQQRAEEPLAGL